MGRGLGRSQPLTANIAVRMGQASRHRGQRKAAHEVARERGARVPGGRGTGRSGAADGAGRAADGAGGCGAARRPGSGGNSGTCARHAEIVNVGKRCGTKSITQEEINALMVERARRGAKRGAAEERRSADFWAGGGRDGGAGRGGRGVRGGSGDHVGAGRGGGDSGFADRPEMRFERNSFRPGIMRSRTTTRRCRR